MNGQEYMGIGYDAMVALALALNASQSQLPPGALENYQYGDRETTAIIKRNLYQLGFDGVSVIQNPVSQSQHNKTNLPLNIYIMSRKVTCKCVWCFWFQLVNTTRLFFY